MRPIFLDAFALASPDSLHILLLDNSGAHTVQRPRWPETVRGAGLPPDCPEPNRIQRVWRGLKDEVAWQQLPIRPLTWMPSVTCPRPVMRPHSEP